MCNVPFDNTYRDIIDWDAYGWTPYQYVKSFSKVNKVEINQLTYLAQGKPIRIPTPFTKVNQYNYVMVENPGRPIDSKNFEGYTPHAFFYFITSVDYIAPNTTQLTLQLDVWSTYYQRIKFGRCYLERGHMGIAAIDSFNNNGREWPRSARRPRRRWRAPGHSLIPTHDCRRLQRRLRRHHHQHH